MIALMARTSAARLRRDPEARRSPGRASKRRDPEARRSPSRAAASDETVAGDGTDKAPPSSVHRGRSRQHRHKSSSRERDEPQGNAAGVHRRRRRSEDHRGEDVLAFCKSLEARVAELEAQLDQQASKHIDITRQVSNQETKVEKLAEKVSQKASVLDDVSAALKPVLPKRAASASVENSFSFDNPFSDSCRETPEPSVFRLQGSTRFERDPALVAASLAAFTDPLGPEKTTASVQFGKVRFHESVAQESVALEESMWDCVLLVGMGGTDTAAAAQVAVLIALNIVAQAVFLFVLAAPTADLTSPKYGDEEVEAFQRWRMNVGHTYEHYNRFLRQSLTARLCENDLSLESSATQQAAHDLISAYVGNSLASGYYVGILMSTLALFVWFLTVIKELNGSWSSALAVLNLPRERTTSLRLHHDGSMSFESLSTIKWYGSLAMHAIRAAICLALAYYGSLFLIYTVDVSELLLNAVALELVITLDELIYEALVPTLFRLEHSRVRSFDLPPVRVWRGLDWRSVIKLVSVAGACVAVIFVALVPQARAPLHTAQGTPSWTGRR